MENLKGKNLCDPASFMRHKKLPTNTVTHPGLLELKSNVVWVGCTDKNCKNEIAIKKCSQHEFHVQKVFHNYFPNLVPNVYEGAFCKDGFYMYSEYIKNGTLKNKKNHPKVDEYVYKVLTSLKKIHDKYPSFRHNDLHVDNVLIKGDTPLIYDFGFANWYGNPIFDSKLKKDYGIYPGNHPMYDFHFFITSVSADLPSRFKEKALKVFPPEYLVKDSPVVCEYRLRSDVKHPNLPTMNQVLQVFSPHNNKMRPKVLTFTSRNKKTAVKRSPPKALAVKFTLANKRRASNRKAELMKIERNKLVKAGMKNNNVNQALKNFEIQAELQAIRNIEALKTAGLLTPSPSPVAIVKARGFAPKAAAAGPSKVLALTFTNSPRKRPRIDGKLCSSFKKDELLTIMRRMGHRVDKSMTLKELCAKLQPSRRAALIIKAATTYTRPVSAPILNVRKSTYPKQLKKPLYSLAKVIGTNAKYKNKKSELVNKIYAKLNKNINSALKNMNKKTVTARQIAQRLATNYKWKNDRHIERLRVLKVYKK